MKTRPSREPKDPGPKVVTGPLHADNKGACDWGYQGLIAYGCHDYVVIVDPKTLQVIQTVGPTPGIVTHIRWTREKYHHAFATGSTYSLTLVTADVTGTLIVWDIVTGVKKSEFTGSLPARTIIDIEWYVGHDASHDLLMVLRNPDVLELWDAYSGMPLWKRTVGETVLSLSLDPFDIHRLILLSECTRVLVVSDVNVTKSPDDEKFQGVDFTDPCPLPIGQSNRRRKSSSGSEKSPTIKASSSWTKMATNLATNILSVPERRSLTGEEAASFTSCVQATFSVVHRHVVVLLFPSAIHFLDVDVGLTISEIRLDRASPTIQKVLICSTVDMIVCLHDNGSSSVRLARNDTENEADVAYMDMTYDMMCQSEAIRLLRQSKLFGFLLHPISESQIAVVLSDGRVVVQDIMATEYNKDTFDDAQTGDVYISDVIFGRKVVPSNRHKHELTNQISLKLVTSGLVSGVSGNTTVLAMIPESTARNGTKQLLAIGNDFGVIQLLNVASGQVDKEYKLFMTSVRGLEWVDPELIVTFTYPDPYTYGNRTVKSSFLVFSTVSGEVILQQLDRPGVVAAVTVSASRETFAVLFEDRPIEIWSIASKRLIREIELTPGMKPFAATFYPSVSIVKREVIIRIDDKDDKDTDADTSAKGLKGNNTRVAEKIVRAEQLFVCGSFEIGTIRRYDFWENAGIDTHTISLEGIVDNQTARGTKFVSICWKKRFLVLCEKSGAVYLIHVKKGESPARKLQHRVGMSPSKVKFGPGQENMKFLVMYANFGVDIFDIVNEQGQFLSSTPCISSSPIDAVWTGPKSIAMATETSAIHVLDVSNISATSPQSVDDGFVFIKDSGIKSTNTPIANWETKDVLCPRLLERKEAFLLKYSLQCAMEPYNEPVLKYKQFIGKKMFDFIQTNGRTVADRCYAVARMFGDEFDLEFWRLVKYTAPNTNMDRSEIPDMDQNLDLTRMFSRLQAKYAVHSNLIDFDDVPDDDHLTGLNTDVMEKDTTVTSGLNVMLTSHDYTIYETRRLSLHNKKRKQNQRIRKLCASRYILQNQSDMAVNVLMETEAEHLEFKSDWLKACLSCCLSNSDSSSISTIKLAATHMMAAGNLSDGVELLCMINKHLDACKYLISNNRWMEAVWIAKTKLNQVDSMSVLCSYADYLWNDYQRDKAILIMMSMGQYNAVIRMLCEVDHFDTAAMFVLFCLDHNLIRKWAATDHVFMQFAKLLTVAGYQSAIEQFCEKAGPLGQEYLKDLTASQSVH